jgi:hypothetical protein
MHVMRKLPVVHICSCVVGQIRTCIPAFRSHKRDVSRSSRTLAAGCDGRVVLSDERLDADGEIVWSWRPWAGVKLAMMLSHHAGDGDNNAWSPGSNCIDVDL